VAKLQDANPTSTAGIPPPPDDLPESDDKSEPLVFNDYIDRLRFLEVVEDESTKMETTLLKDIFRGAMPGLEAFVMDDRYLMLKGKVLFNAIGVAFSGGRLNKVRPLI
jgi:import receptor subunit TOM20